MTACSTNMAKLLSSDVLTVIVGKDEHKQKISVHEALIMDCSEFFRKAMSGKWKESDDRTIILEDEDPEVFAMYTGAIYTGKIPSRMRPNASMWQDPDYSATLTLWASLYALAEKLMDDSVKSIVLEKLYDLRHRIWAFGEASGNLVDIIYESTPGRCGIRQLMVDAAIDTQTSKTLGNFRSALAKAPAEFLEDMACGVATKMKITILQPASPHMCRCCESRNDWGSIGGWGPPPCNCQPIPQPMPEREYEGLDYYMHWVDPEKPTVDVATPEEDAISSDATSTHTASTHDGNWGAPPLA